MSDDSNAIEPTSVQTGAEAAAADSDNLPAATGNNQPQRMSWGGAISGILNFVTLALRIMALAAAAAILKEQLHLLKARMHHDAQRARRLAGHLAQAGVDARFQAQALEVAAAFDRVAEASGEVANAADGMEANANGVRDAHQSEYGGIHETVKALPGGVKQPKAQFNEVH
jgi:hypothetical protein